MSRIKNFEEAVQREGTLNRLPPRLTAIEVRRVVGSVSAPKVAALRGDFLDRHSGTTAPRYRSVLTAMRTDVPLPPVEVYALRDEYFVLDGHHRVAAARALDYLYLDAVVHQFVLAATSDANRLHNERQRFERLTGLTDIELTEVGQYKKLISQIREHRFFLGASGRVVGTVEAAEEWRAYVYAPITEWLAASGVPRHFPGRTLADLYVYLCDYKWIKSQNKGMDIGFPKAMADFQRLYPPPSGAAAAVSTAVQAVGALVRPVVGIGRGARTDRRDRPRTGKADGHDGADTREREPAAMDRS